MSATELRVIFAVLGAIVLALIYFFGRPKKPGQGRRTLFSRDPGTRIEPTLGDTGPAAESAQGELDVAAGDDVAAPVPHEAPPRGRRGPVPGSRTQQPFERIVSLYVAARAGRVIHGPDLVVAAEKAGLVFGDKAIFHRLVSGSSDSAPIFSMANMLEPGSFDMRHIDALQTSGVTFFMTLPGPLPALDAWDAMLPTAQRLAELLDATVLDEERNMLGRQRVAYVRDELRAWDRRQERSRIHLR